LHASVDVVVQAGESTMPNVFEREIKAVWASVQQKRNALNRRCNETNLCIRQDSAQQRLFKQIKAGLERLKVLDSGNSAIYDQNLAGVEADLVCEKSHLKLVA